MITRGQRKAFVNLPVADLERSVEFFAGLRFTFDPLFSSPISACMLISDEICVNLLDREAFGRFTPKAVVDASTATEMVLSLAAPTREHVDAMVVQAIALGGTPALPTQDHGMVYGRSFQDLDGHIWEVMWMDVAAVEAEATAVRAATDDPDAPSQ